MSRTCGIYKITSPSARIYIGQSIFIEKRIRFYKNGGLNQQTLLERSFKKYRFENHVIEIVKECSPPELNDLEIYFIKLYDSFNTSHGLNLKSGGHCGGTLSEESKQKLRKPKSEETKAKLRISQTGRKHSAETKAKHSKRMMGNKYLLGSNHMIGFKHSEATKAIIKEKRAYQVIKKGNGKDSWTPEKRLKYSNRMKNNKYCIGRNIASGQNNPMSRTNILKRKQKAG